MTSIDNLANEIVQKMQEYTSEIEGAIPPLVDKTAAALAKDITRTAPRRTGVYARGWKVKSLSYKASSEQGYAKLVCNPMRYMLAHLLEHGHAKRGGGRVSGKPHINPAMDVHLKSFEDALKEVLRR